MFQPKKFHRKLIASRTVNNRQPRKSAKSYLILVPFVVIPLLTLTVVRLPILHVSQVEIHNDGGDKPVIADVTALKGKNMLFLNTSAVTAGLLKKHPMTDAIRLQKKFPNILIATIQQRVPLATVRIALIDPNATPSATQSADRLINPPYFIDKRAVLYQVANFGDAPIAGDAVVTQTATSLPQIDVESQAGAKVGQTVATDAMRCVLSLVTVQAAVQNPIMQYTISVNSDISAVIPGQSFKVHFADDKNAKDQLSALQTILTSTKIDTKKLMSIDLRFDRPTVIYR